MEQVHSSARSDNEFLHYPTHYAVKGDEIVGAFHLGPVLIWWLHSKKCTRRDSRLAMEQVLAILRNNRYQHVMVLCAHSSPYFDHMQTFFGCEPMTDAGFGLFKKVL